MRIRGWMLKQKDWDNTVWENKGVRKYGNGRYYHEGKGTVLVVELKNGKWIATKHTGGKKTSFGKSTSRKRLEDKCRRYMKSHPRG